MIAMGCVTNGGPGGSSKPSGNGGGGGTAAGGSAGTAGASGAGGSIAGNGGAGGGGASGGDSGTVGTGGSGGSAGSAGHGGDGGASGSAGNSGVGGTTADGWTNIFNGTDLTGWVPLIHKSSYNQDPYHTFRADAVNHVIRVSYDQYPADGFNDRCGLLYYNKNLTNYRVRVTYRFLEPQASNPVSWGHYNSGLMIFGIDPAKVTGDPEFPPLIEIQLLGKGSSGGSTSPNECEPGNAGEMITMKQHTASCGNNNTGMAPAAPDQWVTVEAEVHVNGVTNVYQYPDMTKPVFTMSGPTYKGQPVLGGYLSLQSESQPVEFKDVQLKELPQ
jgi:hypothetical protein